MPLTDILSRQKELSKNSYRHAILVKGAGFGSCRGRVAKFFEEYQLVRYAEVTIGEKESMQASDPGFESKLLDAVEENRRILHGLVEDLRRENVLTLQDLEVLPQGYKSKMLHVITHFLDGFFGIDTFFYNMEEESHWVSEDLKQTIAEAPSGYWLLSVQGRF